MSKYHIFILLTGSLLDDTQGPNVEAALSTSPTQAQNQAHAEPRKALIGAKKTPAAKKGVRIKAVASSYFSHTAV